MSTRGGHCAGRERVRVGVRRVCNPTRSEDAVVKARIVSECEESRKVKSALCWRAYLHKIIYIYLFAPAAATSSLSVGVGENVLSAGFITRASFPSTGVEAEPGMSRMYPIFPVDESAW